MDDVRLALVQGHWCGDRDATCDLYSELVRSAVKRQPQIVCLPEFTLAPYFPQTTDAGGLRWAESLPAGPSATFFSELAHAHRVTVIGSLYERSEQGHRNTAVTYGADGKRIHAAPKVHIPSSLGYHESTFFSGGSEYTLCETNGLKLATPTCYDQWFPEVARIHTLNGAELICYPTAIGSERSAPDVDSSEAWRTVMRGHAIANGVYIAACNRVGTEGDISFYGSSFVCDPTGTVIASAERDDDDVVIADLDADVLTRWRALFPLLRHRRPDTYGAIAAVERSAQ